jgi:uncharacterized protein (DUF488 family)
MGTLPAGEQLVFFTVGHSNQSREEFLALLARHAIEVLVDTRSHPYSKYVAHFNREELAAAAAGAGVKYLFLGRELGGRSEGEQFFDDAGHVLYYRVAESPSFLEGIARVEAGSRRYRVALMCSEEDPAVCHRHLLVGRVLAERGARVRHIRADGSVQAYEDVKAADAEQPLLFDLPEMHPWKSLRSVSRKRPLPNSSDSFGDTPSSV